MREGLHRVSGCYPMVTRNRELYFLADTSVNIEPTAEELVEIALCTAETARRFGVVPRVAMLSFSSFGSSSHPQCEKVRRAVDLLHKADPGLMVDGEMMADVAVSAEKLEQTYPFSFLKGGANVLIFPDLNSANIAYKLLATIGGAETLGPVLMGMSKPVHLVARGAEVEEIVNAAAIAVVDAQESQESGGVPAAAEPEPFTVAG
jgi:malate dehydrogenase (oxaloacetate-decarboxylating)(NADP+)